MSDWAILNNDEIMAVMTALESVRATMAFHSRDWSQDRRDAWLYGILVGWDEASLAELAVKHQWDHAEDLPRLRAYRAAIAQAYLGS